MVRALGLSASILALGAAGSAFAQDNAPATAAQPVAASNSTAAMPTADIVVTAERRTTSLQRTPVAAAVLTGADLTARGVNSLDQLQFAVPSTTVQNFGQGNSFNIRGIGKSESNSATGVGVITYRDGVATFPGYFQTEPYYDIASVEVLRGPQGTFAGQNATGGAVFITEVNPDLSKVGGYIQGQYGNYNDARIQGAINVPLSDTLAVRFATNDERRDSFYHFTGPTNKDAGDLRAYSGRISLLWQPTSNFRVLLKGDYNNLNFHGYPADPVLSTNNRFDLTANSPQGAKDESGRIVLNAAYTTDGGVVLRSISGYQRGTTAFRADTDGTDRAPNTFFDKVDERIFTQEVNIVSPNSGPFTWVLGGYYQNDKLTFPPGQFSTGSPPGVFDLTLQGVNPKTTAAAFGQVTYKLADGLELQAGARYSRSTSSQDGFYTIPEFGLVIPLHDKTRDKKVTGKIALNWTANAHNFFYAFVATGHKASGLNTVNLSGVPPLPFAPENVTDFEAGWKSTLLGGHLKTQLGGYYNRYKGFQVTIGDPRAPTVASIQNVSRPTIIWGLEASGQAVFGALSLNFGLSYSHSSLGHFFAADPRFAQVSSCDSQSGPVSASCIDLTGNDQTYAPKITANLGVQYVIPLGDAMTLTPRVDYSHISRTWATLFENSALGDHLSARNIVNAQLTLAKGPWELTGYTTNLNNLSYTTAINAGLRYAGLPRQYGLRVTRNF
ncbi:TonB-dependent receptor [Sphingomonas sp. CGMCC 1.13654]|uniref:TonB-dependent receptor n=1 Tax=Sphingomonas chungangi TaxID=2683589 RepID=A0A838L6G8_9SPHN|nr:TonB-dependent receptor [Sphingomonas chungangi]MBA2934059.1 TonB-dependent receptor [Sphingomonas chungangi]MVW57805.1 TonB-dependent receptor plug domain-containing protein [Sphingomonas chungangi]